MLDASHTGTGYRSSSACSTAESSSTHAKSSKERDRARNDSNRRTKDHFRTDREGQQRPHQVEIVAKKGNAILISKDDYGSMVETAYLLSSPSKARRLLDSMEAVRHGRYQERKRAE